MDCKPKSNKLKRIEAKRRLELKAERRGRVDPATAALARVVRADQALKESKAAAGAFEHRLDLILRGEPVRIPAHSDLHAIDLAWKQRRTGSLAPDSGAFRRLVLLGRARTDLLRRRDGPSNARALLALSAHAGRWVRDPEDWEPRSHNPYRQFHALVRHLTARYDVPTFLNTAWFEGLTALGEIHQGWFLHVAHGQNIRTASDLPVALTKKQAHLYLQAPADFDALTAFRWAQVHDLGGDERLARSVAATRIATDFAHDDFWITVCRWLIAHPLLDGAHHGPVLDYLHDRKYVASLPNPDTTTPGRPLLVPPQPNLTMKGRDPVTLLRAVAQWHRHLGRQQAARVTAWPPSGIASFQHEEGHDANRKVFTITEILNSRDLTEEGRAMNHCVGTYAQSCASRRTSIWSLRVLDLQGQATRLLTLEVATATRQITQARQKFNKLPSPRELTLLHRWATSGGPSLSSWLTR